MTCTVCGAENPATATICTSCRAFLQNRIPTLDLFQTAWGCLVSPVRTFHAITIAEHKNYALTLFGFAGIPFVASTVASFQGGALIGGFLETMALSTMLGFIVGFVAGLVTTLIHWLQARLVGGDRSFRLSLGIVAYSLVPAAAIGLLIYPIQLLTFGEHWFAANPHPSTINEVSYWTLQMLQWAGVLWSVVLLTIGSAVGLRVSSFRAVVAAVLTVLIVGGGWWWGIQLVVSAVTSASS